MIDEVFDYLRNPNWRRQHQWRKALWTNLHRVGLTGLHGLPLNRRWVDIHRRAMPLAGLDPSFVGFKLVQISDLHYSPVVWRRYLTQYIQFINELEPDMVVVTGDLVTGGFRYATRVAALLSHLQARHGVVCTFGNHDYSMYGKRDVPEGLRRAAFLEQSLKEQNLIVLRNQTLTVRTADGRPALTIVGLDDEWTGAIDEKKAFAGVDPTVPIVCLNHNPANAHELLNYPWQWMLSGHTHGRQLATSRLGAAFFSHRRRRYTRGYYLIEGRHLYVNRGLSYGQRVREWCRPEITVFRLEIQTDATATEPKREPPLCG